MRPCIEELGIIRVGSDVRSIALQYILFIAALFTLESPFLATLHENFLALVQRHPVKLLSFGETVPMKLSWMLQTVLVTNDSAG